MAARRLTGSTTSSEPDYDAHPHQVLFEVSRHREIYIDMMRWLDYGTDARGTYYKDVAAVNGEYKVAYSFQDYGTAFYIKMKYT
jgi:hypothetical protein